MLTRFACALGSNIVPKWFDITVPTLSLRNNKQSESYNQHDVNTANEIVHVKEHKHIIRVKAGTAEQILGCELL